MLIIADFGVAVWDGRSRGTTHMIGLMEGRVFVRWVDIVGPAGRTGTGPLSGKE